MAVAATDRRKGIGEGRSRTDLAAFGQDREVHREHAGGVGRDRREGGHGVRNAAASGGIVGLVQDRPDEQRAALPPNDVQRNLVEIRTEDVVVRLDRLEVVHEEAAAIGQYG